MPFHFQMHLPEMWSLDKTWEVGLFQFLSLQTWHSVLNRQVGLHLLQNNQHLDMHMFYRTGKYVTIQDVMEGWMQAMEGHLGRKRFLHDIVNIY